ncbi:anthocyanidin 3-O-glucoside 6''-O-acyltransferase-like [Daucus carota subsp. sativus]|uniref:anthocyanidin 3-O-glucoside 6''-O-acyltransferase-like n=1 Tax=Daucus carota subsp. sativus TaxID=79200 RepID=UPI003083A45E
MVTVLEKCRISPPQDHSVAENLLPLTFFDLVWQNWPSLSRVYFYDFPCSTSELRQTLVPRLKKSLASTLEHYFPFCGNLIIPTTFSDNATAALRYLKNDSVSLTIAEFSGTSSAGFEHLSADHARDVNELFSLIPELPPGDTDHASPVLSIQVTLFPGQGFSIGFRNSHLVADGRTMFNFIATWASINAKQLKSEDDFDTIKTLPFYDRSVIKDAKGMTSNFLKIGLQIAQQISKASGPATHELDLVQETASIVLANEIDDENEVLEHMIIAIDTRARLDPPIPSNYFGNAVSPCKITLNLSRLRGQEGFVYAAKEIKEALHEQINNDEGVLRGLDTIFDDIEAMKGQKIFGVAGSPKLDYYSTDFGFGKPKKYEVVSEKFSLAASRDSSGGLELGFAFSKNEMDAFTSSWVLRRGCNRGAEQATLGARLMRRRSYYWAGGGYPGFSGVTRQGGDDMCPGAPKVASWVLTRRSVAHSSGAFGAGKGVTPTERADAVGACWSCGHRRVPAV